jgi:hypothetical protein
VSVEPKQGWAWHGGNHVVQNLARIAMSAVNVRALEPTKCARRQRRISLDRPDFPEAMPQKVGRGTAVGTGLDRIFQIEDRDEPVN